MPIRLGPQTEGRTKNFTDLAPEQQEKARACKTPEEMLVLAKEEGFELSDEDLEAISGGNAWDEAVDTYMKCQRFG